MKFIQNVHPRIRTFLLAAVALAAPAGETGFQVGAWGEVFYSRPMGAWAIVTALLLALVMVPRKRLPVPPAYLLVLLIPSIWILLKMFMMDQTGGRIFHPVLFGLGAVSYLLCLPFAGYLIIKIINPDLLDLKGIKPKLSLAGIFLFMFLAGFVLGRNNDLFVRCEDFILAGDAPPANCRPKTEAPADAGIAFPGEETLRRISGQYVDAHRGNEGRGRREDFSRSAFLSGITAKEQQLAELEAIDPTGLNAEQDIDRRLLTGLLRSDLNTTKTLRRWETNPPLYLPSTRLGLLLEQADATRPGAELDTLLRALPERLQHGRANLKRPPARFTRDAIFQARSSLKALDTAMPAFPTGVESAAHSARTALADWLTFLEEELLPRSDGSWALGREAYDYILRERWHMPDTADDIHQRGWQAFEETEAMAAKTAARMQPGKHWTAVYESLKTDHPSSPDLKQAYQDQMDRARQFVRQHKILTLPEGERVITLDTPPAMRRSSPFGTFEMVDPFDDGLEGRLYLTPVEDWMTPEQQAARLSSHHNAWIPVIAVHEAYPGHHAHGIKMKDNPNDLRRVVTEPIFSEGWGLFTEELMFEQGFLQGDAVRLTVLRNRLWRAARVILDSGLHTGKMDFGQAVDFLVERVRFEPYAAELEVGMYIREPTYVLGYLVGMQEVESIRDEWISRFGQPEPPSEFYDRLLSVGSIPPALAREALFGPEQP